jgi:hypothetical protein
MERKNNLARRLNTEFFQPLSENQSDAKSFGLMKEMVNYIGKRLKRPPLKPTCIVYRKINVLHSVTQPRKSQPSMSFQTTT